MTGFKTAIVEIERPSRFAGDSKYDSVKLRKIINWASSAILSHTTFPLTLIATGGTALSLISLLGILISIPLWLVYGVPFAGFGTIVGVLFLGFYLILLSIGVMAQCIGLIYEEVKGRPIYIKAEDTNQYR